MLRYIDRYLEECDARARRRGLADVARRSPNQASRRSRRPASRAWSGSISAPPTAWSRTSRTAAPVVTRRATRSCRRSCTTAPTAIVVGREAAARGARGPARHARVGQALHRPRPEGHRRASARCCRTSSSATTGAVRLKVGRRARGLAGRGLGRDPAARSSSAPRPRSAARSRARSSPCRRTSTTPSARPRATPAGSPGSRSCACSPSRPRRRSPTASTAAARAPSPSYDLGGGTFDISILKLDDGVFEVKRDRRRQRARRRRLRPRDRDRDRCSRRRSSVRRRPRAPQARRRRGRRGARASRKRSPSAEPRCSQLAAAGGLAASSAASRATSCARGPSRCSSALGKACRRALKDAELARGRARRRDPGRRLDALAGRPRLRAPSCSARRRSRPRSRPGRRARRGGPGRPARRRRPARSCCSTWCRCRSASRRWAAWSRS